MKGDDDLDGHHKDVVETRLKKLVCNGHMRLRHAQRLIAIDWGQGRPLKSRGSVGGGYALVKLDRFDLDTPAQTALP